MEALFQTCVRNTNIQIIKNKRTNENTGISPEQYNVFEKEYEETFAYLILLFFHIFSHTHIHLTSIFATANNRKINKINNHVNMCKQQIISRLHTEWVGLGGEQEKGACFFSANVRLQCEHKVHRQLDR